MLLFSGSSSSIGCLPADDKIIRRELVGMHLMLLLPIYLNFFQDAGILKNFTLAQYGNVNMDDKGAHIEVLSCKNLYFCFVT